MLPLGLVVFTIFRQFDHLLRVAKLIAGFVSGSTGMLAESAHSFADSLNEVLLAWSLRRARKPPDSQHP